MFAYKSLEKIRVLDLSRLLPGPFASMMLRKLGAQIDKIEDPHAGDYLRDMPPQKNGVNACFSVLNKGNRSAVINLRDAAGRADFLRILPRYDVLLESFRPGVMERLGLGLDDLLTQVPTLVACSIAGFPHDARPGHDLNFMADSGALDLFAGSQVPGVQVADVGGAMLATTQICAALAHRAETGRGAVIRTSLYAAAELFALYGRTAVAVGENHRNGSGPLNGGLAVYNVYTTRDGERLAIAALEPHFLQNLALVTNIPLDLSALVSGAHQEGLHAQLQQRFFQDTASAWLARASTHECCMSRVVGIHENAVDIPSDAPRRGEHTAAILAE